MQPWPAGSSPQSVRFRRLECPLQAGCPSLICPAARQNAVVVKSPKSGVSFWSYGDYEQQFEAARQRALPVLRALLESDGHGGSDDNAAVNGVVPAPRLASRSGLTPASS